MLENLPQLGQIDNTEVQQAVDHFKKNASNFQDAISTRNQARWMLSGEERLTQAVDELKEYNNGLFEITKNLRLAIEFNVGIKLPFRQNLSFYGRTDVLDRLYEILEPRRQKDISENSPEPEVKVQTESGTKTATLHGLGGTGESLIALEYSHRFSQFYTSIFWIDAAEISRTTESACKIVEQLVHHQRSQQSVGELDKLIPMCDWVSIVITSRLPNLQRFGKCVEVEGIGAEEGLELLFKSFGKDPGNLTQSDLDEARKIVCALGELPLALDQAGAYIRSLQISFSAYRKGLKKGIKACFRREISDPSLPSYKASILTT
ncbi:hypothetical protein RUND412_008789 [Rhizina undulata]